jgi:hypothetical protein
MFRGRDLTGSLIGAAVGSLIGVAVGSLLPTSPIGSLSSRSRISAADVWITPVMAIQEHPPSSSPPRTKSVFVASENNLRGGLQPTVPPPAAIFLQPNRLHHSLKSDGGAEGQQRAPYKIQSIVPA